MHSRTPRPLRPLARSALIWLAVCGLSLNASSEALSAPVQWTVESGGNGHWYELVFPNPELDWVEARAGAENRIHLGVNGHLATVTSAAENDFLRDAFSSQLTVQIFGTANDQPGDFVFLGMSFNVAVGEYEWVTGEPVSYTGFAPPEPNNPGTQNYIIARVIDYGGIGPAWWWDDHFLRPPEADRLGYIVEYETNPVPEPTTALLLGLGLTALAVRRGE